MWNDAMEKHYLSCAFPTLLDTKQLNMTLSLFHQIRQTGKHIQYMWVPPQTDVAPTIHVLYLFHYKLQICREPFPGLYLLSNIQTLCEPAPHTACMTIKQESKIPLVHVISIASIFVLLVVKPCSQSCWTRCWSFAIHPCFKPRFYG